MAINEKGQLGMFSEMSPCYTIFHKHIEIFSNIWTEYSSEHSLFCSRYEEDIKRYGNIERFMAKPNPPANTFPVSMIPRASFEGFNLNLKKRG